MKTPDAKAKSPFETPSKALVSRLLRGTDSPVLHCLFVLGFYALVFLAFFFPAIYHGHFLAVGADGLYFYLPNYYSPKTLWDPLLFSGFPMMADPQTMTCYPPAALLSLFPGTWNLFMLLGYVLGSSFMYGYVFSITRSRFAALVSGLVFGLSGFMIAHLVHAVIIQSVAWVPLIIWSLENLRHKISARWIAIGSLAVALCFLGGHSQIFFYSLILSACYTIAFGWRAPAGRARYFGASLLVAVLGLGLAAIQLLPTAELARQGLQGKYSFSEFAAFGLPPRQLLTLIFPLSFGAPNVPGVSGYFGAPNQVELTGYLGLLPLILAAVGIVAARHRRVAVFWICVAAAALLLAMGDTTPLARVIYQIPILNSFRAPARHLLEVTIALSALSGLGVAAIARQEITAKVIRRILILAGVVMLAGFVLVVVNPAYRSALAAQHSVAQRSLTPWVNWGVGIPILVFLISANILILWSDWPAALLRRVSLIVVLVIDLGSFGWCFEWRSASLTRSTLAAPPIVARYRSLLETSNQRLLAYRNRDALTEMAPNLTRLWRIPNVSGFNVLAPRRTRDLVPTLDDLSMPLPWTEPNNRSADLMAARYVFAPRAETIEDDRDIVWLKDDVPRWLGAGCNQPDQKSLRISLPAPVRSNSLAIVSRLACATEVSDLTPFARVRVIDETGEAQTKDLLAGRDSSEWAHDCVAAKHQRTEIFSSYPAEINAYPCEGHRYLTKFSWDRQRNVQSIEFEGLGKEPASVIVDKLSLLNEETRTSIPVDLASASDRGWRLIDTTATARIFENLRVMPRVWLTSETVTLSAESALQTIKTGRLPTGREFDPARIALVEEPVEFAAAIDEKAEVNVTKLANDSMEVRTSSTTPRFLVTSDVYYPGWQVSIDGRDSKLYRADYAIRGVIVPAGEHTVHFVYRPRSFYLGAVATALSIFVLSALCLWNFRPARKR